MTTIHVNRSFRALRERQLASLTQRNIRLYDRRSLVELAEFDGGYLNHRERPRVFPTAHAPRERLTAAREGVG